MLQVLVGQQTENFKKPKHKNLLAQYEAQSFSLVCKDRTVDLICEDPMQTFTWIKGKHVHFVVPRFLLFVQSVRCQKLNIFSPPIVHISLYSRQKYFTTIQKL